jgi:hypothetical protein
MPRRGASFTIVTLAVLGAILAAGGPAAAQRAEAPRRGSVLLAAIAAESTLLQIDAYTYPKVRYTRALDPAERKRLIGELEKVVLENAYHIPGLWWARSVVHWAGVKNYVAPPNHYSNQKLQDVWLAED